MTIISSIMKIAPTAPPAAAPTSQRESKKEVFVCVHERERER